MDLQSPSTLFAAWILAPAVIVLAAGGLGGLVARITGVSFGALTFPVGFLTGIVLMAGLVELGAGGTLTAVLTAVVAVGGAVAATLPAYRRASGLREFAAGVVASRDRVYAAMAATAAYLLALAPLVGSGRAGVLGYILNNDPSAHSTLVELLRDNGAEMPTGGFISSYDSVGELFREGYPLGSHVWPLFGRVTTGVETFFIWSPVIAVAAAMLTLIAYACLRRLDAPVILAAPAAALVPCGYLFYSFLIQGSAKEAVTAVAVYGSIAIAGQVILDQRTWRAAPAVAIGPAAALFTFGAGAASWIAPALVTFLVIVLWRLRDVRPPRKTVIAAVLGTVAIAVVSVPLISEALDYVQSAESILRDPAEVGNLLGAVPWQEMFNLWFAYDFRIQPPTVEWLSDIGPWVGGAFAVLGLIHAARKRDVVLPIAVLAGAVAAIVISERYNIYLDTKAYAILAPALGMAAAAGVAALVAGPRLVRVAGIVAGGVLAAGVLGGASLVYAGAWVTPKDRFEEVADIADRFEDTGGPILVNDREEWEYYLLRELDPVVSWGLWFDRRGFITGEEVPPPLPHTPDFDDFKPAFVKQFELLLERKAPGGSRAPSNYRVVYESPNYRVWQRDDRPPARHLVLGRASLENTARLDCGATRVRRFMRAARRSTGEVIASVPTARTVLIADTNLWQGYDVRSEPPPPGMINRRGGRLAALPRLAPGRYTTWIQGTFGPGVRMLIDGREYGDTFGDLGLPSAWHPLGEVQSDGSPLEVGMLALEKPWWQSGSQRSDLTGQLVFEPAEAEPELRRIDRASLGTLCGERLDWLELPG